MTSELETQEGVSGLDNIPGKSSATDMEETLSAGSSIALEEGLQQQEGAGEENEEEEEEEGAVEDNELLQTPALDTPIEDVTPSTDISPDAPTMPVFEEEILDEQSGIHPASTATSSDTSPALTSAALPLSVAVGPTPVPLTNISSAPEPIPLSFPKYSTRSQSAGKVKEMELPVSYSRRGNAAAAAAAAASGNGETPAPVAWAIDPSPGASPTREEPSALSSNAAIPPRPTGGPSDPRTAFHPSHTVSFDMPNDKRFTYPPGTRMFIGNLASEKTDKHELARIFAPYGNIHEIVIREAYGFIQFDDPGAIQEAISRENGRNIGGIAVDLNVSKDRPGKGARGSGPRDLGRRGEPPRDYRGDPRDSYRDPRDMGGRHNYNEPPYPPPRGRRDEPQDPWPPRGGPGYPDRRGGDRDFPRGGDYRDDRRGRRRHSRSPSPYGYDDRRHPDDRYDAPRGPPPPAHIARHHPDYPHPPGSEVSVPAHPPRRYGPSVPQCQLVILGDVDRGYLSTVDATLRRSGLAIDTLFLSPKMNLGAIVEQFKTEGVKAIVFLNKMLERSGRVAMQQFKPNGQVQEYESILPEAAIEIMSRSFPIGPPPPQPPMQMPGGVANPLAALVGQAGPGGIASVIASLASAAQAQGQTLDPNTLAALASLAGAPQSQQPVMPQQHMQQQQQPQHGMSPYGGTGGYQQQQQPPPQSSQPLPGRYAYNQPPPMQQQQQQQIPSPSTGNTNLAALLSSLGGSGGGVSPTVSMGFSSSVPAYQSAPQPPSSSGMGSSGLPSYTTMGYGKQQQPQQQQQMQQVQVPQSAVPPPSNKTESVADILNRLKSLSGMQKR